MIPQTTRHCVHTRFLLLHSATHFHTLHVPATRRFARFAHATYYIPLVFTFYTHMSRGHCAAAATHLPALIRSYSLSRLQFVGHWLPAFIFSHILGLYTHTAFCIHTTTPTPSPHGSYTHALRLDVRVTFTVCAGSAVGAHIFCVRELPSPSLSVRRWIVSPWTRVHVTQFSSHPHSIRWSRHAHALHTRCACVCCIMGAFTFCGLEPLSNTHEHTQHVCAVSRRTFVGSSRSTPYTFAVPSLFGSELHSLFWWAGNAPGPVVPGLDTLVCWHTTPTYTAPAVPWYADHRRCTFFTVCRRAYSFTAHFDYTDISLPTHVRCVRDTQSCFTPRAALPSGVHTRTLPTRLVYLRTLRATCTAYYVHGTHGVIALGRPARAVHYA